MKGSQNLPGFHFCNPLAQIQPGIAEQFIQEAAGCVVVTKDLPYEVPGTGWYSIGRQLG